MGTDKGLLVLNGKTFMEHICDALFPIVGDSLIIVSAEKRYDDFGFSRVEDVIDNKGPIGGIYTGLRESQSPLNLVLSVDVPLVSTELLKWLLEGHRSDYMVSQLKCGDKNSPLIGVYDRAMLELFEKHLAMNQLRLQQLIKEVKHQSLEVPQQWCKLLQNINTKEDYQKII